MSLRDDAVVWFAVGLSAVPPRNDVVVLQSSWFAGRSAVSPRDDDVGLRWFAGASAVPPRVGLAGSAPQDVAVARASPQWNVLRSLQFFRLRSPIVIPDPSFSVPRFSPHLPVHDLVARGFRSLRLPVVARGSFSVVRDLVARGLRSVRDLVSVVDFPLFFAKKAEIPHASSPF